MAPTRNFCWASFQFRKKYSLNFKLSSTQPSLTETSIKKQRNSFSIHHSHNVLMWQQKCLGFREKKVEEQYVNGWRTVFISCEQPTLITSSGCATRWERHRKIWTWKICAYFKGGSEQKLSVSFPTVRRGFVKREQRNVYIPVLNSPKIPMGKGIGDVFPRTEWFFCTDRTETLHLHSSFLCSWKWIIYVLYFEYIIICLNLL